MLKNIKENLLKPALSRVGTAVATWLTANTDWVDIPTAQAVEVGVLVAGLLIYDLSMSFVNRKRA